MSQRDSQKGLLAEKSFPKRRFHQCYQCFLIVYCLERVQGVLRQMKIHSEKVRNVLRMSPLADLVESPGV